MRDLQKGRMILQGERRVSKAIPLCLRGMIGGVAIGVATIIFALVQSSGYSGRGTAVLFGIRFGPNEFALMITVMIAAGLFFIVIGILYPFLLSWGMKKVYIDVYEDRIVGQYEENKQPIPFEFTYDKIESVNANAKKNAVYIQLSGRTLETRAFNSQEIAKAIKTRLGQDS